MNQPFAALDRGIGYFSDLVGVESVPALPSPSKRKRDDRHRVDEIDECVAHIAVVGKIDAEIEKVVDSIRRLVEDTFEHQMIHFIGDVPQHDLDGLAMTTTHTIATYCGPNIQTRLDSADIDLVAGWVHVVVEATGPKICLIELQLHEEPVILISWHDRTPRETELSYLTMESLHKHMEILSHVSWGETED